MSNCLTDRRKIKRKQQKANKLSVLCCKGLDMFQPFFIARKIVRYGILDKNFRGREMEKPILVFCTVPDENTARLLAKALVDARLAACVNCSAASCSVYRWEGKVEEAREFVLTIKTVSGKYDAVETTIKSMHPYDLPEILAVPVLRGLASYLDWVIDETA